jgi:hypothetical protein
MLANNIVSRSFTGRIERVRCFVMKMNPRPAMCVTGALIALVLSGPVSSGLRNFLHPPRKEHIRPAMSYLSSNRLPSDMIYIGYVHYDAIPPVQYYASAFGFQPAVYRGFLPSSDSVKSTFLDPEKWQHDIDPSITPKRVWFVFSHDCGSCRPGEEQPILQHIETAGRRLASFSSESASVYLYDLKDGSPQRF